MTRIFSALRKLETVRAQNEVFKANAEFGTVETRSQNVLGLRRASGAQELLALFNFCGETRMIAVDRPYLDLMTGKKHTKKTIELPPYGFMWALLK